MKDKYYILELLSPALPELVNIKRTMQDDSSGREGLRKFRVVVWYELPHNSCVVRVT